MTRRNWVALDNASNIFLAARSEIDPKVFRISAEMAEEVDPEVLQRALDLTFDRYPLYHAVLRRGVFWYYLQDSDLRPRVRPETGCPCSPIYQPDRRNLLFRVLYRGRRVMVEIFHALSDGTGALWFLTDLVDTYCGLRGTADHQMGSGAVPGPGPSDRAAFVPRTTAELRGTGSAGEPVHELTTDSFAYYFRRHRRAARSTPSPGGEAFRRAAAPAVLSVRDPDPRGATSRRHRRHLLGHGVYQVRGTLTPDNRPRVVELTMDAGPVLALARGHRVGLTIYLTALFLEAVRLSSPGLGRATTLTASVPVNLRQFFSSTSARNFFATIRVGHRYGREADDIDAICRDLDDQFTPSATREALEQKLRRLIRLERLAPLRIFPSPLKDVILRLINWGNNRGLTVAVSNLGLVRLPEASESQVGRMMFHTVAVRPQFCAVTHAGRLTISFTSPFIQTGHVKEFVRLLTREGVDVTVAVSRVTEAELGLVGLRGEHHRRPNAEGRSHRRRLTGRGAHRSRVGGGVHR
ncbi:alcohol acetyltransferase [Acidipropionibacterium jensenii]|uniref:Alcohol acetyltransferase n=1 Tax=Acidipropionibacterium jensenii TaxID=1749 RepID=A0A448NVG6_9ACTN|nr:alcohol acetyltransferase [Acidipropionibacterium jensenii]MDN5977462.1 alcohol acetyltransferase [Acidipropionibacterium jensenii]MDN5996924.1 alcohol acetyltransferase [Acidipropionibacterium jensenii]MDN6426744.1 alcohol acetyltransferase [Acidipropionibacterium jensenii]MDN6441314.1 alcohol acetyltransferase [Acidipropionibacterium jensenii]MDN6479657.1 alcohol acetyltransferase [Acidipropionibacterium jensenii]